MGAESGMRDTPTVTVPETANWRVMTWNVHGAARPDLRAVAAAIASQDADVVVLQEVRPEPGGRTRCVDRHAVHVGTQAPPVHRCDVVAVGGDGDHDAADARLAEARRVAAIIDEIGSDPVPIVAGDLNDGEDRSIIDALRGVEAARPSATCPSLAPTEVLDHVLVPADATDVTATVPAPGPPWSALSDHLPVTVSFRLAITPGV
jgi:endonuclease/exonuclease/phosphatase family metal-dependent hydrolase